MTVLSSGEYGGASPAPPPPPPPSSAAVPATSASPRLNGSTKADAPNQHLLMADIRNGVTLKPTKTKDNSTPAFIKKSGGANTSPSSPPAQLNGNDGGDTSMAGMKDALQVELRNTLKRKVKKQDVERGDSTKKDEIEKAMETSRTEVQLKVNTSTKVSPAVVNKDTLEASVIRSNGVQSVPNTVDETNSASNGISVVVKENPKTSPFLVKKNVPNSQTNGVQKSSVKTLQLNGDIGKPPAVVNGSKVEVKQTTIQNTVQNSAPPKPARTLLNITADASKSVADTNVSTRKEPIKQHSPVKVDIKPYENSRMPLNGTLRKVSPQKPLTIDVTASQDNQLKNTILSPEVVSGNAAIRPSQIKSLTQQGSHVSHTHILENPKPIGKSPISLVESPQYSYTPPTPKSISPASSSQASPRTPTRTTILDTKISNTLLSPKPDPNAPQKKLMISHPKASFTLKRNSVQKIENVHPTEPKPVFRILSNLEQSERVEAEQENKTLPRPSAKRDPPKPDEPGVEPILTSFVSFAKELGNAPNNYPDLVTKKTTVGVVKQDLFLDNTNLRDIKIDIVEGGQLKVVSK
ncbi:proteoglycan 4 isoform X2 [Aedes aegypti]|uniref:Uncharacterized protein n=1 Tax=Aedes aegypti TaxID=7159 RepID=A0A6I8TEM2_AEDAE|nr:proteoglycan 4 isoform X2 [Aedes aegypti]